MGSGTVDVVVVVSSVTSMDVVVARVGLIQAFKEETRIGSDVLEAAVFDGGSPAVEATNDKASADEVAAAAKDRSDFDCSGLLSGRSIKSSRISVIFSVCRSKNANRFHRDDAMVASVSVTSSNDLIAGESN